MGDLPSSPCGRASLGSNICQDANVPSLAAGKEVRIKSPLFLLIKIKCFLALLSLTELQLVAQLFSMWQGGRQRRCPKGLFTAGLVHSIKTSPYPGLNLVWLERGVTPMVLVQGILLSVVHWSHPSVPVCMFKCVVVWTLTPNPPSRSCVRCLLCWRGLLPRRQAWGC